VEFIQLSDDERSLWVSNARRLASGPPFMRNFNIMLDEMSQVTGIDWFDMDQILYFGLPPSIGYILAGDFDADAITSAYTAQDGYEETEINGVPAICSEEGCDAGQQTELRSRNPANPFGGDLGRREPLALLPGFLVNSSDLPTVESILDTAQGAQPSLLDNDDYRLTAEAITQGEGELIQAMFLNPASVNTYMALPFATPEAGAESPMAGYGELPSYLLAALADRQEGDEQVVLITLVYADEETAQAGGEELAARLRTFSPPSRESSEPAIAERGGVVDDPIVYTGEDSRHAVAVVAVRSPAPGTEPDDTSPSGFRDPGLVFRLLVQSVYARELLPLVVSDHSIS
jgi:hypothetical protein